MNKVVFALPAICLIMIFTFLISVRNDPYANSGVISTLTEDGLLIKKVYSETAAFEGGLKAGDLIIELQGYSTARLNRMITTDFENAISICSGMFEFGRRVHMTKSDGSQLSFVPYHSKANRVFLSLKSPVIINISISMLFIPFVFWFCTLSGNKREFLWASAFFTALCIMIINSLSEFFWGWNFQLQRSITMEIAGVSASASLLGYFLNFPVPRYGKKRILVYIILIMLVHHLKYPVFFLFGIPLLSKAGLFTVFYAFVVMGHLAAAVIYQFRKSSGDDRTDLAILSYSTIIVILSYSLLLFEILKEGHILKASENILAFSTITLLLLPAAFGFVNSRGEILYVAPVMHKATQLLMSTTVLIIAFLIMFRYTPLSNNTEMLFFFSLAVIIVLPVIYRLLHLLSDLVVTDFRPQKKDLLSSFRNSMTGINDRNEAFRTTALYLARMFHLQFVSYIFTEYNKQEPGFMYYSADEKKPDRDSVIRKCLSINLDTNGYYKSANIFIVKITLENNDAAYLVVETIERLMQFSEEDIGILHEAALLLIEDFRRLETLDQLQKRDIHYKTIYDEIPVCIFETDKDGCFLFLNQKGRDCLKLGKNGILKEHSLLNYIDKNDHARIYPGPLSVYGSAENSAESVRIIRPDGTNFMAFIKTRRITQDNEQRFFGIIVDQSEQLFIKNKLKLAQAATEQAMQYKKTLIANTNHEMRTPLNGISGMISLLKNTETDNQQKEFLSNLDKSVSELIRIVDDITLMQQLENRPTRFDRQPFTPVRILSEIIGIYREQCFNRDLKIIEKLELSDNSEYIGYPGMLRIIIRILIDNAVKYTDEGEITVTAAISVEKEKPVLRIGVADTGIGIEESKLNEIFESFSQGDQSYTKTRKGLGLGLSVCKNLINNIGGTLTLRSKVGRGSLFEVAIPLEDKVRYDSFPTDGSLALPEKLHILVAEDEKINRIYIRNLLTRRGWKVDEAVNGKEVVDDRDLSIYDLILMDISMPEMNGIEATRIVRQKERTSGNHIPIIAVTAHIDSETRKNCEEAGMDGFLTKPLNEDHLISSIRQLLVAA